MGNIAESIAEVWKNTPALCALVPYDRVFTGRVPGSDLYKFPYVTIDVGDSQEALRTDKATQFWHMVSIGIWVREEKLAEGETISNAITDAYANQRWQIDAVSKVIDVTDDGPGPPRHLDYSHVKAWWISHTIDLRIEHQRRRGRMRGQKNTGEERKARKQVISEIDVRGRHTLSPRRNTENAKNSLRPLCPLWLNSSGGNGTRMIARGFSVRTERHGRRCASGSSNSGANWPLS